VKAYITGGTGFVGSNIVKVFADRHGAAVHCPVHRFVPEGDLAYTTEPLDLLDTAAVHESVQAAAPDVIVHSMILNDFARIYAEREVAWDSYVGTTATLVDAANAVGAAFVLVSTDWVFDGTQGGADETTAPNPINYYGVLKLASEQVALARSDRTAVARVSGVNGVHWARPTTEREQDCGFGYFVASMVDALSEGRPFTVWEDDDINMVATPSLASQCGELIHAMACNEAATGIFHCCGADATGRRELAELACEVFELDAALLRTGLPDPDSMPGSPIPHDTSLRVGRTAEILGIEPLTARELLTRFRLESETRQLVPGGTP
jgi:dTDP-4-dehydrorhamnose reductase